MVVLSDGICYRAGPVIPELEHMQQELAGVT